jgi:ectoine hydroxylase-related dioxygenase (phytanoyl-CoA dioxygenase family)
MQSAIERFHEQGYAILYGLLEDSCIGAVQQACEILVDNLAKKLRAEGKISETFADAPFERRLIRLYENRPDENPTIFRPELHLPGFFHLFAHPRLLDLAERILGPEIRLYPNYSVRPKLPNNKRTEALWHQDAGYTSSDADALRMMNVWTPLVPANEENGCMQFIPGSHKRGVAPHEKDQYYLRIHDGVIKPVEDQAALIEMTPGDVVIFSNLLFHRGLPNQSDHIRWSVDFRYQDATQPTLRQTKGHLLRSKLHPEQVVRDAEHWAELKFQ